MVVIDNPNLEETVVIRVETSTMDNTRVEGIDPREIKYYTDETGSLRQYIEMQVPISLKEAYAGNENTLKKRDARLNRCLVPGKQKAWIRCPECNKCSECPMFDKKRAGLVSLDQLAKDGVPEIGDDRTPEDETIYYDMLDNLIALASKKRERLGEEVKLLHSGYSKEDLPDVMGISKATMYDDLRIIADLLFEITGLRR